MEYEKQTFEDRELDENGNVTNPGTTLTAAHLQHMEDGIGEAFAAITRLQEGEGGGMELNVVTGTKHIGAYIENAAYVQSITNEQFCTAVYPVTAGQIYTFTGNGVRLVVEYPIAVFYATEPTPGDKTNVGAVIIPKDNATTPTDYAAGEMTYVPATDGYIAIASHTAYPELSLMSVTYTDGEGTTVIRPVKLQVLGDSVSAENWGGGDTWVSALAEHLPGYELTVVNAAVGGNTLTSYTNGALQKGVAWQVGLTETTAGSPDSLGNDSYAPVEQDADVVIVFAGTNDWAGIPSGELLSHDPLSTDPTTVEGAVNTIITALADRPDTRLLFITPLQRYNSRDQELEAAGLVDDSGLTLNCENGVTLEQLVASMYAVCNRRGVDLLDLYHMGGVGRHNLAHFSADGLHPNSRWHGRIAQRVAAKLREMV